MKFLVSLSSTTVSIIIQDGAETIFHMELPGGQDTIAGWYKRFTYLRKTQPQELNELLGAIPQLLEIQVNEDTHPTYLNLLHALFKWAEEEKHELQEQSSTENDIPNSYGLHQQLKHALFNFEVITSPDNEYYEAIFPQPGQEKLRVHISSNFFDKSPLQTSQVVLKKAQERDPKCIEYFIHNYSHIQEYVISSDPTTFNFFIGLSKALINLIKQESASLGRYISRVPDICMFILKNERVDIEARKVYLEPILNSSESEEQKLERLEDISDTIKKDVLERRLPRNTNRPKLNRPLQQDESMRLMQVIRDCILVCVSSQSGQT